MARRKRESHGRKAQRVMGALERRGVAAAGLAWLCVVLGSDKTTHSLFEAHRIALEPAVSEVEALMLKHLRARPKIQKTGASTSPDSPRLWFSKTRGVFNALRPHSTEPVIFKQNRAQRMSRFTECHTIRNLKLNKKSFWCEKQKC